MLKNKKRHIHFVRVSTIGDGGERGVRTLAPLTAYELSKPAPSASWVFLRANNFSRSARVLP